MIKRSTLFVLPLVAFLAACSQTTQTVYQYQPRPVPAEPATSPVNMRPGVEWKVLTKKELQEQLAELEKNPDPNFALFALTPKGFEALSSNMVEISRFMQEQQEVIKYYRAYVRETAQPVAPVPTKKPKR